MKRSEIRELSYLRPASRPSYPQHGERALLRPLSLQHASDTQVLIDIGPVNTHRHDLVVFPLRYQCCKRGYHASGVAILRPSKSVTTSSLAVNSTMRGTALFSLQFIC